MNKPKVAALAVPPLVMTGEIPSQYVYPGFLEYADEHCERCGVPMHRFVDGKVVCLHCVEAQVADLETQPYSYHDNFFAALHEPNTPAWRQLIGAATQSARCAGTTAEISIRRFIVTAAHRLGLETAVVAGRVMTGDIAILLPPVAAVVSG